MRRGNTRLLTAALACALVLEPVSAQASTATTDPAVPAAVSTAVGSLSVTGIEDVIDSASREATRSDLAAPSGLAAAQGDDSDQAEPDPEAEGGRLAFVLIPLLAAAVVVVGAIMVIARGRRGRRGD